MLRQHIKFLSVTLVMSLVSAVTLGASTEAKIDVKKADISTISPACQAMLRESSALWINKNADQAGGSTIDIEASVASYSHCYDQKINQVKQKLLAMEKYPLMGERAEFADFQRNLEAFANLVLAANAGGGSYDRIEAAYAMMYQKQFSYYFYAKKLGDDARLTQFTDGDPAQLQQQVLRFIQAMPEDKVASIEQAYKKLEMNAIEETRMPKVAFYRYMVLLLTPAAGPPCEPPF